MKHASCASVSVVDCSTRFIKIIKDFPIITGSTQFNSIVSSNVTHRILTTGPPVAKRARRRHSERLLVAKTYFREMENAGKCLSSSSTWAAVDGGLCGDYSRLNSVTIPNRCTVPFIQYAAAVLYKNDFF